MRLLRALRYECDCDLCSRLTPDNACITRSIRSIAYGGRSFYDGHRRVPGRWGKCSGGPKSFFHGSDSQYGYFDHNAFAMSHTRSSTALLTPYAPLIFMKPYELCSNRSRLQFRISGATSVRELQWAAKIRERKVLRVGALARYIPCPIFHNLGHSLIGSEIVELLPGW